MIQVTVRQFRNSLAKYLKIPCQVLSHGIPIANIIPTGKLDIPPMPKKIKKEMVELEKELDNMAGTTPIVYPTATGEVSESKTFWFNGKKYLVDENGNEKEVK